MFDIRLEVWNQSFIFGFRRNLFCILWNISTVFIMASRGHGCECVTYARSIVINIHKGTKLYCSGGGRFEVMVPG